MDNIATNIRYKKWKDPPISVVTLQSEIQLGGNNDREQTNHDQGITAARSGANESRNNETFTVEDAVEAIGFGSFQWKLSVITGLSWVVFIGMGLSSYLWGSVCDRYGRKQGMVMSALWILFYGLLSTFAPTYAWILILRGLVGFGIGGVPQLINGVLATPLVLRVTYYSEFLPTKSRGTCVMLISVFWALGATAEILLALLVMPTLGWHWLLGLSTLPVVLFLSFCFWLPESIRFHVMTGNRDGAITTLKRIAAENGKMLLKGTLSTKNMVNRGRIKDLLIPQYRRTTLLLWFIWFVNVFSYYGIILLTTELFQSVGVCTVSQGTNIEPSCSLECKRLTVSDYKDLLWTTFSEFPGLFVVVLVINTIGRKRTMAVCFVVFSLCILPVYACIGRKPLIVLIFMARAVIAGGYQAVYVYTPEVFPTETRAVAMGTCSGMGRLGALLTPFVAQVLLRSSVRSALSLYCGFCLLAAVAAMFLPVETSGRGLEETSDSPQGGQESAPTSPPSNGAAPSPPLDTLRGTQ